MDSIDDAWRDSFQDHDGPVLEARVSGAFARVMSYIEIASACVIVLFGVLFDMQFLGTPFYVAGAIVGVAVAYLVLWKRYQSARATHARDGEELVRIDPRGITLMPSEEIQRETTIHLPWTYVRGVRTLDVPQQRRGKGRYDLYCGFDILTPEMTEALAWDRFDEILLVEEVDASTDATLPDLPAYAMSVMVNVDSTQHWLFNGEKLPLASGNLYEQVPALFRRFSETFAAEGSIDSITGRWWLSAERKAHLPSDYVDEEQRTFGGEDPWKFVNAARYPVDEIAEEELAGAAEEASPSDRRRSQSSNTLASTGRSAEPETGEASNGKRNSPGRDVRAPDEEA
ncbi:hypothetical protein CRI94_17250 [Longibacter salinarum]|uniref:Uncharacterized protein n=2 Tax=Longibacter salinarum TaxID=1850348 RepID=A0A2A8CTF2_9BACT|nr:hypothetical protein CRI94_17250 [Longibacter salinarum]